VELGEVRALFTVGDRLEEGGGVVEEGEDIEVLERGVPEALRMVRSGEIVDGKTIMLLPWLADRSDLTGGV
jgi:hypothetical protein